MKKLIVTGDLEANGLLDTVSTIWCGAFKELGTERRWFFGPDEMEGMIEFLDSVDVLIMHNGIGYDLPAMKKVLGYKYEGQVVDTLIMSRLMKPSRRLPPNCLNRRAGPHSVEAWGYRVGLGKPEHDEWDKYSEDMARRCKGDVEVQELIYNALKEEGKGKDWRNAQMLSFRLFEILQLQEEYGWKLNIPYAQRCVTMLTRMIERIDNVLDIYIDNVVEVEHPKKTGSSDYNFVQKPFKKDGTFSKHVLDWLERNDLDWDSDMVGGPFTRILFRKVKLGSGQEVKNFMLGQGWQPEEWNYNDEGERTSPKLSPNDAFIGVNGKVGKLVAKRVTVRHRRSQIEGWLNLVREDGRVAARVTGLAETGRAKHAGIVNVPGGEAFFGHQMRKCFVARDGYKIVGTDSAGCQNRMLAARVGDPFFTETLINGKKEDGTSIHHVNQKAIREVAGFEVSYKQAKTLNYAFMFGASDGKLGSTVGGGKAEGERIRAALLSVAAGFEELVNSLTTEWRSNARRRLNKWNNFEYFDGWIRGLDGRPIFIPSEHMILVYMLQSDEAIMMSAGYCFLYQKCRKKGWVYGVDYGFLAWIHDEYQIEVKEEYAEEMAKMAEDSIVQAGEYYKIACPHKGESDIGVDWSETH